jgi:uncharacterized membrane protein
MVAPDWLAVGHAALGVVLGLQVSTVFSVVLSLPVSTVVLGVAVF